MANCTAAFSKNGSGNNLIAGALCSHRSAPAIHLFREGFRMEKQCSACGGHGAISGPGGVQRCPMCEGSGAAFDPGLFFTYEMGPVNILANGTISNFSLQILDRSFRWMLLAGVSTGVYTVQIKDSRNKRPFTNQQVHNQNIVGTAQNPLPLLTPFLFEKRGAILADFTDLSGAPNTVRLNFIGVELSDDLAA